MAAPPRNRTTEEKAHVDNDALQRFCGAWRDMQCSRRGGGGGDAFVVGAVTINLWSLTPNDTTWTKLHSLPIRNVLRGWEEEPTSHPAAAAEAKRGGRSKKRKKKKEEEVRWLCREKVAQPLAMVGDGRMAVWARGCEGAVRLHDPRTGACEEVAQVEKCGCVLGFYSGALSPSHAVEMEE
uniref:Uncharacterized protein n=1 Tax=Oryza rufipogon TaxID=4529 RepID=A0A0E0Q5A1_ORYRU